MLKIGIMCRGDFFHAWESKVIYDLIKHNDISIELLIVESKPASNYFSLIKKISIKHLLWQAYMYLSSRLMKCDYLVNMEEYFTDIDRIVCKTLLKGKFSQYFIESDIDYIRSYDLDVILRFGFNIIRGQILNSAKYGVWSYHHDDNNKYRGMPSCFWEIYNSDPVTGAVLQQLTDVLDGGVILKRGYFPTVNYSYSKSRDMVHGASSIWVSQVCRSIIDCAYPSKSTLLYSHNAKKIKPVGLPPIYGLPSNLHMTRFVFMQLYNFLKMRAGNAIYRPHWSIGIVKGRSKEDLFQINKVEDVSWISSPKEYFMADPFLIKDNGIYYIFFEQYKYSKFIGQISMIKTNDFESFSEPEVVINKPFHLSYPYVFKYNNRYYCTPEQYQSGKVSLYESQDFPYDWKEVSTIVEFTGLDPTIIFHEDKWWLFAGCDKGDGLENSELYLWSAENLLGSWSPHPQNPVKVDIRSSRPGGRPFLRNGRWIRPAQDCSVSYGRRLVFNEIITLTETCYEEHVVHLLEPGDLQTGMHTFDYESGFCIVDGLFLEKSYYYFGRYMMNNVIRGGPRNLNRWISGKPAE